MSNFEYKLGKRPALQDPRTLQFRSILPTVLPEAPIQYDVDFDNENIWPVPQPMFANDKWGCCVISLRANQTLRFEKLEQGVNLDITDDEILKEYWAEQGDPEGKVKPDNGLYLMESLRWWRNKGWVAGGKEYNIYAYAKINHHYQKEIKLGVYLLTGLYTGAILPQSCMDQLERKEIWTVVPNDGGIIGGHAMYMMGYTRTGPVFLTWGRRQVATWEWAAKYMDECYGVVDDKNKFMDSSPIDIEKLNNYLNVIARN